MNEKIENQLNLALGSTVKEREKSLDLNVGFDQETKTWEVVVKFFGTKEELKGIFQREFKDLANTIGIDVLSNEYVILVIPENLVDAVASIPEIEYMEKPKQLLFAIENGKSVSCINSLQKSTEFNGGNRTDNLTGEDVLVAIIDSGIDYSHPDFRNENGTTRIFKLWDQSLNEVFDQNTINLALKQPNEQLRLQICPSVDVSGHGTHVAGIAAGNGRASNGRYRGIAYKSELIIVKLANQKENSLPRTTDLMKAVDFCLKEARILAKPIAINLSFGNNYGSHSGTSLIETYLNDMADFGRNIIVIGSGNEGASAIHTSGNLKNVETDYREITVSDFTPTINLQIWKNYVDEFDIYVVHPNGTRIGPLLNELGIQRFRMGDTNLLIFHGVPSPYSPYQEIYFEFLSVGNFIDSGIWRIEFVAKNIVYGDYNMWLPSGAIIGQTNGFLEPVEEITLTIPSTATKGIAVGAYDGVLNQQAAFSGRGFTRETNQVKPDIVAPGVDIISCAPGGGYVSKTGTSMATPFVTGAGALLMQWGIVNGNDIYLYGEKLRAYLIRGANRNITGFTEWPNPILGWGLLCVSESLPK